MYFRNLFSRNNVKASVKDGFAPAEDLLLQVFTAYIIAAFIDFTGMTGVKSLPSKIPIPDEKSTPQEKSVYLDKVIGPFVDSYCLTLPNVEDEIKRQIEQQHHQNTPGQAETSTVSCSILPGTLFPSNNQNCLVLLLAIMAKFSVLPNGISPLEG